VRGDPNPRARHEDRASNDRKPSPCETVTTSRRRGLRTARRIAAEGNRLSARGPVSLQVDLEYNSGQARPVVVRHRTAHVEPQPAVEGD